MPGGYFKRFGKYKYTTNYSKIKDPKLFTDHIPKRSTKLYDDLFYQFAVIDPGSSSCAIRIERCYLKTKERKLIWFSIVSFGKTRSEINNGIDHGFRYVKKYLIDCNHIGVEYQLMKSEIDYQCYSAMLYYITNEICTKGLKPCLFTMDVKLKTTYIGGPTTSKQNGGVSIKEWSKRKAKKHSKDTNDLVSYNILKCSYAKAYEDLSDAKCYAIGFVKYIFETSILKVPFNKKRLEFFI